jgi:hypothetical protein
MVIPSGRRNSLPALVARASGSAPNRAAIVVISMGLKRSIQASPMACSGVSERNRCAEIAMPLAESL